MNFNKFAELGDLKFEKAKKVFELANEARDIAKLNAEIEQQQAKIASLNPSTSQLHQDVVNILEKLAEPVNKRITKREGADSEFGMASKRAASVYVPPVSRPITSDIFVVFVLLSLTWSGAFGRSLISLSWLMS